jgi:hypothetical protein
MSPVGMPVLKCRVCWDGVGEGVMKECVCVCVGEGGEWGVSGQSVIFYVGGHPSRCFTPWGVFPHTDLLEGLHGRVKVIERSAEVPL